MSVEAPPVEALDKRQETLDFLKALTPQWLELKQRNERSNDLDSRLGRENSDVYAHMNGLLDKLGVTDGIPA